MSGFEAVGLVLNVTGLFNQILDCFETYYRGENFTDDYDVNHVRLTTAQLRLSRWGSSVDFGSLDDEKLKHVERSLNVILSSFERAEKLSDEFGKTVPQPKRKSELEDELMDDFSDSNSNPPVQSPCRAREESGNPLLVKMKHIVRSRHKAPIITTGSSTNATGSGLKTLKWAVYSGKHMKDLVNDIVATTTELINLIPDAQESQAKLCENEVFELTETLRNLAKTIKDQDKDLFTQLAKMLSPVVNTLAIPLAHVRY
ncbi:hypothetical protein Hte_012040 [Hypoxylon texense]